MLKLILFSLKQNCHSSLLNFFLQFLTHLRPLVTEETCASDLSVYSWNLTLPHRLSTSLHRPLAPHSLPSPPSLGRALNSSHRTPTWTPLSAPLPKAAAPPRWERAWKCTPHRALPPSLRAGSHVRSRRSTLHCSPRLLSLLSPQLSHQCHPSHLVLCQTVPSWLLLILQLQSHPRL